MKREQKVKNPEDYETVIVKEMKYYALLARELNLSEDVLVQAARLGVRDGIYRHRQSTNPSVRTSRTGCKYREEECVTWNIRRLVDLTLVRAALLAASEEEMDKAEEVLMRLIED